MYDLLFRKIVFAMKEEDMYEFCVTQYKGNLEEHKFLADLKKNYIDHCAVWWYRKDTFLYRMLNKTLHIHQYDTLYSLRAFIRRLHEQIVEQQKNTKSEKNANSCLNCTRLMCQLAAWKR